MLVAVQTFSETHTKDASQADPSVLTFWEDAFGKDYFCDVVLFNKEFQVCVCMFICTCVFMYVNKC